MKQSTAACHINSQHVQEQTGQLQEGYGQQKRHSWTSFFYKQKYKHVHENYKWELTAQITIREHKGPEIHADE